MIEILPMKDSARERELLAGAGLKEDGPRVLFMTDRGEELGWVALELDGDVLRMLKFSVPGYDFGEKPQGETVFVLDALMRAAASFGETNGAAQLETAFPDFYDFFRLRGFKTDETHAFGPVSLVVKYG